MLVSLLSVIFVLSTSVTGAYAGVCPQHNVSQLVYTFERNKGLVGSHTENGKNCRLYEIVDVYVYQCYVCSIMWEETYYSHISHELAH